MVIVSMLNKKNAYDCTFSYFFKPVFLALYFTECILGTIIILSYKYLKIGGILTIPGIRGSIDNLVALDDTLNSLKWG